MTCRPSRFSKSNHHTSRRHGFTMIETLVALAILGLFFTAVTLIIQNVLTLVGLSRVKTTALALAQEKMEIIRNLPYASVGTVDGIPQGPILQTETVTINSLVFTVKTSVIYIDDPFDGIAPADIINTDYKRVRVEITWGGIYASQIPLALVTNIVPKGKETIVAGGTLFIQIYNANGQPVPNATITIDNTDVIPAIHTQTLSDSNGLVIIPGAPTCVACYKITVTKTLYSTDRTYGTNEAANPIQPHATVIEGNITHLSYAIDEISTLKINSLNQSYQPTANVMFTLRGNKIIGYDTSDMPVYKYSYSTNTGGGTVTIPGLEWDTYILDFSNSAHTLAGSNPTIPFALTPKINMILPIVAVPKANASLLVIVKDSSGMLQSSASATLFNQTLGYNLTKITHATGTADFGQAFFPNLTASPYDLSVTLPGFQEATSSVVISTNQQESIILNYQL